MSQQPRKFNVDLALSLNGYFLTDPLGNLSTDMKLEAKMAADGISKKDVEYAVDKNGHCFKSDNSFLAWCAPQSGKRRMHVVIEFEISDEFLPDMGIECAETEDQKDAWRAALLFHGPAALHAAKGLQNMSDAVAEHCRCFVDFSAFYGAAICVMIPLELTSNFDAIEDLLFQNGLPFPPSNHARIGAASQIAWVLPQSGFPTNILPDAAD